MQLVNNLCVGGLIGTFPVVIYSGIKEMEQASVGNNRVGPLAMSHAIEAGFAASFTAQIWEFSMMTNIGLQLVSMLAVGVLYAIGQGDSNNICTQISQGISTMYRLSHILNVIALLYFGNIVMGAAVLMMGTVALLNKYDCLPEFARPTYRNITSNEWFIAIAAVFATSGPVQLVTVYNLGSKIYKKWCAPVAPSPAGIAAAAILLQNR